jgi:hypothetical protein
MALASNALTTVADVKTYMGVTSSSDDTLIETLVNNVSDQIERWCDRVIVQRTVTEFLDARADRTIALSNAPVISVDLVAYGARDSISVSSDTGTDLLATVSIEEDQARLVRIASDGTSTTSTLTFASNPTTATLSAAIDALTGFASTSIHNAPSFTLHRMGGRNVLDATAFLTVASDDENEYRVDFDRGLVHLRADAFPADDSKRMPNRFPNSFQSVLVRYSAGYSTLPNAIVQAAFELISDAYRGRDRDRAINNESLGGYSYTVRPWSEWTANVNSLLAPFRRVR